MRHNRRGSVHHLRGGRNGPRTVVPISVRMGGSASRLGSDTSGFSTPLAARVRPALRRATIASASDQLASQLSKGWCDTFQRDYSRPCLSRE